MEMRFTSAPMKWLAVIVATLVVGAVASVAIVRLTPESPRSDDVGRARADAAIIAQTARKETRGVSVAAVQRVGDRVWRVVIAVKRRRVRFVLDTAQFRVEHYEIASGVIRVSCAFKG
jgi:hypothetical protein